jgi:hypothetical protein
LMRRTGSCLATRPCGPGSAKSSRTP